MASHWRQCIVLLVACFQAFNAGVLSGLFCKDPDTGKFHPINSTWSSTTFCGSYTCKFIKRNMTHNDNIMKVNITSRKDIVQNDIETITQAVKPSKSYTFIKSKTINHGANNAKIVQQSKPPEHNADRFLTEDEIKAITSILHTVKKSDIDSIIEIYNLAQDIYSDVEEANSGENLVEATEHDSGKKTPSSETNNQYNSHYKYALPFNSYWYEPVGVYTNIKNREYANDMTKSSSNLVTATQPMKDQLRTDVPEAKKISYYYPMSSFQRLSSYVYDPYGQQRTKSSNEKQLLEERYPPCNNGVDVPSTVVALSPWINRVVKKPFSVDAVGKITRSLLPFPFSYIHRYNISSYPEIYFNAKYWNDINNNDPNGPFNYYKPEYVPKSQFSRSSKRISSVYNINDDKSLDGIIDLDNNKEADTEEHSRDFQIVKPNEVVAWQTDSIPPHVLDEVRAHIIERSFNLLKSNPRKKSVKLERVGKLVRLDDIVARSKRQSRSERISPDSVPREAMSTDPYEPVLITTM